MLSQLPIRQILPLLLCLIAFLPSGRSVRCVSCVGRGCMTRACDSDVCVGTFYAAKWNEGAWTRGRAVRGCMSGTIVNTDFRDHCENTADEFGNPIQTCYCKSELCNGRLSARLPTEPMKLVKCNCEGRHCAHPLCIGRMCTYTINHLTMQTERGCTNFSLPLAERRIADACMSPPVAGALHTNVARTGDDLLHTEQCLCTSDFCNAGPPLATVPKEMKCQEKVRGDFYGHKMSSIRHRECPGEFCFSTDVKSDYGEHSEFTVTGCISFLNGSQLADELNPTGCGYFSTEGLKVRSCFTTNDQTAVDRALDTRPAVDGSERPLAGLWAAAASWWLLISVPKMNLFVFFLLGLLFAVVNADEDCSHIQCRKNEEDLCPGSCQEKNCGTGLCIQEKGEEYGVCKCADIGDDPF